MRNAMSTVVSENTQSGNNIDMLVDYTNYFVDMSTTRQKISRKSNRGRMINSKNLLQRNWKPITILLLVLACIVLSFTYCQPTFIRILEMFERLTITSQL